MEKIAAGTLLLSASTDEADIFERAVVLLVEANEDGHTGFMINKKSSRKLNELNEFRTSKPFPLYNGGPVDKGHLFFIHQQPGLIDGGALISDHFFLGGDFTQAVQCIDQGLLTEKDIKLFIGYCGWDEQQLEEEIAQGEWKTNYAALQKILTEDTSMLWWTLL